MAAINLKNLARMTVSSSGTGTITLNTAVSGFLTFDLAGCSTAAAGAVVRYAIADTTQSELAFGTYTSSAVTLTRGSSTTGMKSTNADSPINMSNAAQVFITDSALDHPIVPDTGGTAGTLALNMTYSGTSVFSAATTFSAAITYGGVALNNAVTGTGNMVLSASPTFTGTLSAATASLSGSLLLVEGAAINWDSGDVTMTQSGNSLTVAGGNLIFPGTATNDSAGAGIVGEYASGTRASGAALALTTATPANITSMALTAGDWDVYGVIHYTTTATTRIFALNTSVNDTSATVSTAEDRVTTMSVSAVGDWTPGNAFSVTLRVSGARFSLNGATTVFLVSNQIFDTSTLTGFGMIWARRVR